MRWRAGSFQPLQVQRNAEPTPRDPSPAFAELCLLITHHQFSNPSVDSGQGVPWVFMTRSSEGHSKSKTLPMRASLTRPTGTSILRSSSGISGCRFGMAAPELKPLVRPIYYSRRTGRAKLTKCSTSMRTAQSKTPSGRSNFEGSQSRVGRPHSSACTAEGSIPDPTRATLEETAFALRPSRGLSRCSAQLGRIHQTRKPIPCVSLSGSSNGPVVGMRRRASSFQGSSRPIASRTSVLRQARQMNAALCRMILARLQSKQARDSESGLPLYLRTVGSPRPMSPTHQRVVTGVAHVRVSLLERASRPDSHEERPRHSRWIPHQKGRSLTLVKRLNHSRNRLPSTSLPCNDRDSGEGLPPPLKSSAPHGARAFGLMPSGPVSADRDHVCCRTRFEHVGRTGEVVGVQGHRVAVEHVLGLTEALA